MDYKHQYFTDDERQQLLSAYADKVLVEEQNVIEGNFLIFADEPRIYETILTPTEQRIRQLEQLIADLASIQLGV